MVKRFQGRNAAGAAEKNDHHVRPTLLNSMSGSVNNDTLSDLKRDWSSYYTAYDAYKPQSGGQVFHCA